MTSPKYLYIKVLRAKEMNQWIKAWHLSSIAEPMLKAGLSGKALAIPSR